MTAFDTPAGPRFRVRHLGEKWPDADFLVELLDAGLEKPFFFVQVKTTWRGYSKKDHRLLVTAKAEKVRALAAYPAPTYIVGIDADPEVEAGYLVSANGEHLTGLSSMSTEKPINLSNRQLLWDEVREFWSGSDKSRLTSKFADTDWR